MAALQLHGTELQLRIGALHLFRIRLRVLFELGTRLVQQTAALRRIGGLARLLDQHDAAMIGNLSAELLIDELARPHPLQIIERQLVQPALLETAQKLFAPFDSEGDCGQARDKDKGKKAVAKARCADRPPAVNP